MDPMSRGSVVATVAASPGGDPGVLSAGLWIDTTSPLCISRLRSLSVRPRTIRVNMRFTALRFKISIDGFSFIVLKTTSQTLCQKMCILMHVLVEFNCKLHICTWPFLLSFVDSSYYSSGSRIWSRGGSRIFFPIFCRRSEVKLGEQSEQYNILI